MVYRIPESLPPRLRAITELLDCNLDTWDIGADHAWVAAHAKKRSPNCRSIVVDRSSKVIERLRLAQNDGLLDSKIELVNEDVRQILCPAHPSNIVFAGVGAYMICKMLEKWSLGIQKHRLILAPETHVSRLQETLQAQEAPFSTRKVMQGRRERTLFLRPRLI